MGNVEGRNPLLPKEMMEKLPQIFPNAVIEGRQRLIEEDDTRFGNDCPGDSHPLLLPTREFMGPPPRCCRWDSHAFEEIKGTLPILR